MIRVLVPTIRGKLYSLISLSRSWAFLRSVFFFIPPVLISTGSPIFTSKPNSSDRVSVSQESSDLMI